MRCGSRHVRRRHSVWRSWSIRPAMPNSCAGTQPSASGTSWSGPTHGWPRGLWRSPQCWSYSTAACARGAISWFPIQPGLKLTSVGTRLGRFSCVGGDPKGHEQLLRSPSGHLLRDVSGVGSGQLGVLRSVVWDRRRIVQQSGAGSRLLPAFIGLSLAGAEAFTASARVPMPRLPGLSSRAILITRKPSSTHDPTAARHRDSCPSRRVVHREENQP
jgi:hypothetical protein